MKNVTSTMPEICEEFISSTLRRRNLRRPSRMLARNWKHQWLPLCLARFGRTLRIVGMVKNPRVFWKTVNPQDCVWENHCRLIMKTILQEKETIHCCITIWCRNLFYASSHENFRSKGSSGQGMGIIGENLGVEPDESKK